MILGVFTLNDVLVSLVAGSSVTVLTFLLLRPLVRERKVEIVQVSPKHARKPDK